MTKLQAIQQGLSFTGSYSHDKEEQKFNAGEIRKQGYRAVVVNVPPDKLSRGHHGMGYSVYAEKRYFDDKEKIRLQMELNHIPVEKETALNAYKKALQDINAKELEIKEKLKSL